MLAAATLELMQALRPVARWYWGLKLRLVDAELRDVREDMDEALENKNYGVYCALTDFYVDLHVERSMLRRKLGII